MAKMLKTVEQLAAIKTRAAGLPLRCYLIGDKPGTYHVESEKEKGKFYEVKCWQLYDPAGKPNRFAECACYAHTKSNHWCKHMDTAVVKHMELVSSQEAQPAAPAAAKKPSRRGAA
jgi:hypothetical protein